jgi:ADP-ribosylation factor-binding protein GGA
MVEEESDDTEAVVKLLELNDVINTMVEKYNLTKKGEYAAARALPPIASNPPPAYTPTITEDSLIDLGGDTPNGSLPPTGASSASALQEDLLGLSIDDPNGSIGVGGGIALGFGANTSN